MGTDVEKPRYNNIMVWIAPIEEEVITEIEEGVDLTALITEIVDGKITDLRTDIANSFVSMSNTVKSWIGDTTAEIRDWLAGPLSDIESAINLVFDTLSKFKESIKSVVDTIMSKVTGMFESAISTIKGVFEDVWSRMETIYLTIKDVVNTMKDNIVNGIKTVTKIIGLWLKDIIDKLKSGLQRIGADIVTTVHIIVGKITSILDSVKDYLTGVYQTIKGELEKVYVGIKDRLKEIIDTAKEVFGNFIDRLIEFFQAVWEFIKTGLAEIKDLPLDLVEEIMYRMAQVQINVGKRLMSVVGD